jgi:hypothetical protein
MAMHLASASLGGVCYHLEGAARLGMCLVDSIYSRVAVGGAAFLVLKIMSLILSFFSRLQIVSCCFCKFFDFSSSCCSHFFPATP